MVRPPTFGAAIPFFDHQLGYESVTEFAEAVQELGYDALWLSDHLLVGPPPWLARTWYDAPTLLAGWPGWCPT
jgi:alkanesulfonate monooxygenase SsuD/methylene tetrahydromethanopterin reductase-like flavin-dependent oxidoreductase (luciferase family)